MSKRVGRPPIDPAHPSVSVTFRLSSHDYDLLFARSRRERMDVSQVIRNDVRQGLRRAATRDDEHDDE